MPWKRVGPGFVTVMTAVALAVPRASMGQTLPPDEDGALARLDASPRHGEWVTYDAGGGDEVRAWVVYPERSDAAPVVVVIHEIFGLTDWVRAVADQLAAEGYIAVAPDLLTGHGPGGGGSESMDRQGAVAAIRTLNQADVHRRVRAAGAYGLALPAAATRVGVVGFCWGGGTSFSVATDWADLDAAVVYYGTSPEDGYAEVRAPVLGLYGGNDNRVNATIPTAEEAMAAAGASYAPVILEGAGHGFLRNQAGQDGANMSATERAWPRTVAFFREHLGR